MRNRKTAQEKKSFPQLYSSILLLHKFVWSAVLRIYFVDNPQFKLTVLLKSAIDESVPLERSVSYIIISQLVSLTLLDEKVLVDILWDGLKLTKSDFSSCSCVISLCPFGFEFKNSMTHIQH
jgi:hypothetical protein